MFPAHNQSKLRSTRFRRPRPKSRRPNSTRIEKRTHHLTTTTTSTRSTDFHDILNDLRRSWSRFSLYSISELEPICQQLALQRMPSTSSITEFCPLLCTFCQNLICEPITLTCGHTFCEQCIKDEQLSPSTHCPRCPQDTQGQIQSSIAIAREKSYKMNCFLKDLFERSERFKKKYETISQCRKGILEYSHGNYQNAIDIYSCIIDQYDADDHMALYNRAKAYAALQNYDQGLIDAQHIVAVKPKWTKGYLCQGEILFEMKHYAAALMSSLKALVIDTEDPVGKQTMAKHLHAVIHSEDDGGESAATSVASDFEYLNMHTQPSGKIIDKKSSVTDNSAALTLCKTKQSSNDCFCLQIDYKKLQSTDFECSICSNLFWFPVTTPCGHVFCRECLIRSVDNTQAQCPICKNSLQDFFSMLIQSHINRTELISKIIETYFPTEHNDRRILFEQENSRGASIPRSIINDTNSLESAIFEIPVFVCVVAFPNCSCPLHVFEPRYRLMMRRAVATESRVFGMCTSDEQTGTFVDYGTLLYIRGLMFTQDGRSIVDTIGQRRFRVLERGTKDGYCTARVELIRDNPIDQQEFDELCQLNRTTYDRARDWFNRLDQYKQTLIMRQIERYPTCDDLVQGPNDGPSWAWILLNLLPIEESLQYTALASFSLRTRLQMINNAIDFLLNQQQQRQQQQTQPQQDNQHQEQQQQQVQHLEQQSTEQTQNEQETEQSGDTAMLSNNVD